MLKISIGQELEQFLKKAGIEVINKTAQIVVRGPILPEENLGVNTSASREAAISGESRQPFKLVQAGMGVQLLSIDPIGLLFRIEKPYNITADNIVKIKVTSNTNLKLSPAFHNGKFIDVNALN